MSHEATHVTWSNLYHKSDESDSDTGVCISLIVCLSLIVCVSLIMCVCVWLVTQGGSCIASRPGRVTTSLDSWEGRRVYLPYLSSSWEGWRTIPLTNREMRETYETLERFVRGTLGVLRAMPCTLASTLYFVRGMHMAYYPSQELGMRKVQGIAAVRERHASFICRVTQTCDSFKLPINLGAFPVQGIAPVRDRHDTFICHVTHWYVAWHRPVRALKLPTNWVLFQYIWSEQ